MLLEQAADRVALGPEIDAALANFPVAIFFRQRDPAQRVEPLVQVDLAHAEAMRLERGEDPGHPAPDDAHARHRAIAGK